MVGMKNFDKKYKLPKQKKAPKAKKTPEEIQAEKQKLEEKLAENTQRLEIGFSKKPLKRQKYYKYVKF